MSTEFINPPELGVAETLARRLRHGRFVLIPASLATHGHGTHTWAGVWQQDLAELLSRSALADARALAPPEQ